MGRMSIVDWYKINHMLRFYHHISDETILNWIPYERDLYMGMIAEEIKKKGQQ